VVLIPGKGGGEVTQHRQITRRRSELGEKRKEKINSENKWLVIGPEKKKSSFNGGEKSGGRKVLTGPWKGADEKKGEEKLRMS